MPDSTISKRTGAIAFPDMLGAKGIATSHDPGKVIESIYDGVTTVRKAIAEHPEHYSDSDITVISDTIVVEFRGDTLKTLIYIAELTLRLFPLFLSKHIPLRGAVAFGEYYRGQNTFLGQAVDDAATWYEEPQMIGVVLTPRSGLALEANYPAAQRESLHQFWVPYNVPSRGSRMSSLYCLNWPAALASTQERLQMHVEHSMDTLILSMLAEIGNIPPDIEPKYRATEAFVRSLPRHVRLAASSAAASTVKSSLRSTTGRNSLTENAGNSV